MRRPLLQNHNAVTIIFKGTGVVDGTRFPLRLNAEGASRYPMLAILDVHIPVSFTQIVQTTQVNALALLDELSRVVGQLGPSQLYATG